MHELSFSGKYGRPNGIINIAEPEEDSSKWAHFVPPVLTPHIHRAHPFSTNWRPLPDTVISWWNLQQQSFNGVFISKRNWPFLIQTEKCALNFSDYLGRPRAGMGKWTGTKAWQAAVLLKTQPRTRLRWTMGTHLSSSQYRQPALSTSWHQLVMQHWASCLTWLCFSSSSVKSTLNNVIFQQI